MNTPISTAPSIGTPRRIMAAVATTIGSIVWTHALAGPLRAAAGITVDDFTPASLSLTLCAVLTALAGSLPEQSQRRRALSALGMAGVCIAAVAATTPVAFVPFLALVPVGVAASVASQAFARWLPARFDARSRAQRRWGAIWLLGALLAVVQVGRLATYITDPHSDWFVSTRNPLFAKHECANAYLYAAELGDRGVPNLYDEARYPGLTPNAKPETQLVGMVPEDPFQYPPQFLLLPRLATALTHDYGAIRAVWFALNLTLCLGAVVALAAWVGGRVGRIAGLLTPLVLVAFPVLHNFQYGQFHFAAVALAVVALLAFDRGRQSLGGLLLAFSILAKVFPGLLLIVLAAQRRWRALAWTAGWGLALTVATLFAFGPDPFVAFVEYQVPRLSDGRAFAFGEAWPELADIFVAGNQGVYGLFAKLARAEVPGIDASTARWAGQLYAVSLLAVALWVGARMQGRPRCQVALRWLAVLGLGSLASTGAWADYVPLTCVWLLAFLAPQVKRKWAAVGLGLCAVFQVTLLGTLPIGEAADPLWMLPLSFVGALAMLVTFLGGLNVGPSPRSASASSHTLAYRTSASQGSQS